MNKINIDNWREFKISKLFDVKKGTRLTKANMIGGDINFIGASAANNGVTAKIGNTSHLHPSNTITVSYNGSVGETFYQTEKFWASDDVNVLYPRFEMNQHIAFFFIPIIKQLGKQYAFIDKWKKEDMEQTNIFLPATPQGEPDFQYMEEYIKNIEQQQSHNLQIIKSLIPPPKCLNTENWKSFSLSNLFDIVLSKGDIQAKKVKDGEIPLVSSGKFNNGICKYIAAGDGKAEIFSDNTITTDMFGKSFYQEKPFYAVSHGRINILLPKFELNKHRALYLVSVLDATFLEKYSFSGMCNQTELNKEFIKLPATPSGEPDFQYMEQTITALITQQQAKLQLTQTTFVQ